MLKLAFGGSPIKQKNMLKKIIIFSILLSFLLAPFSFSLKNANFINAETIIYSTKISEDTTWILAESPYVVSANIIIQEGFTLTIEPGVIVKFEQNSLIVRGALNVLGEESNPVIFTSIHDDARGGQSASWSNGNPLPGDWGTIKTQLNGSVNLNYAVINYGGWEIAYLVNNGNIIKPNTAHAQISFSVGAVSSAGSSVEIQNSEIAYNKIGVTASLNSLVFITDSEIHDNVEGGIINYNDTEPINAVNNWWGDDSGPYHPTLNPDGLGDSVSDNVLFDPWIGQNEEQTIDPVIIVPGIMGSWNLGGEWQLDPILNTYDNLWEALKLAGYIEGENLFAFPYQWRLPNAYTADLLKEKIDDIKEICDCEKVDIVAHSMGGLVARSYIEGADYEDDIDQLIFLATPHKGATNAYLTWEGGEVGPTWPDKLRQRILTLEAEGNGYGSVFKYVRGLPMQSVQELLPIYDYLRDADTMELREYSEDYPVNTFLELLNNPSELNSLNSVNITNILADAGTNSTINSLRVVENESIYGEWEHGYPENYSTPFTDHGLEYGSGDTTVPERSNIDFMGLDNVIIASDHNDIVTDAQKRVIKELTGVEPNEEVRMNIFKKFLLIRIFSPADFIVIAPDGKKLGKDFTSGQAVNEILGAFYSGFDGDIEFAVIPEPLEGDYKIELEGTGDGEYTLSASFIDEEQDIDKDFTSNIQTGQNQEFGLTYSSEAEEPISDLEPEVTVSIDSTIADIEMIYENGWIVKKADKKLLVRQLKHLKRKLKHFDKKIERLEELLEKIEDNSNIDAKKKKKILKRLNKKLEKIIERRQRTINRRLDLLERTLNRVKRKNKINEQGYDIIISDINYLRINL